MNFSLIYEQTTSGRDITGCTFDDPDEAGKYHIGDEITLHLSAGDETFVVFAKYVNRGFGRLHFYRTSRHGPSLRV